MVRDMAYGLWIIVMRVVEVAVLSTYREERRMEETGDREGPEAGREGG